MSFVSGPGGPSATLLMTSTSSGLDTTASNQPSGNLQTPPPLIDSHQSQQISQTKRYAPPSNETYLDNVQKPPQFKKEKATRNLSKQFLDQLLHGQLAKSQLKGRQSFQPEGAEATAGQLENAIFTRLDKVTLQYMKKKGVNPNIYHPQKIWGNSPILNLAAQGFNDSVGSMLQVFSGELDLRFKSSEIGTNLLHVLLFKNYKDRNELDAKEPIQRFEASCSTLNLVTTILEQCPEIINDQTKDGDTALHIACVHRDYELVKLLLANGANPKLANNDDKKPADMLSMSYEDVNDYLMKRTGGFDEPFSYHPYRINEDEFKNPQNLDQISQEVKAAEEKPSEMPKVSQSSGNMPQVTFSNNLKAYWEQLNAKFGEDVTI